MAIALTGTTIIPGIKQLMEWRDLKKGTTINDLHILLKIKEGAK